MKSKSFPQGVPPTSTFQSRCQLNPKGMVNWHPVTEPCKAAEMEGPGRIPWDWLLQKQFPE